MNIYLAGASGAIGRRLIPLLTARGHRVTGTTRSEERAETIRKAGAEAVVLDALDGAAVMRAVAAARAEVVVHQMTALAAMTNLRKFEAGLAATNRLRTEGTEHLLAAARLAGARRFVAQSFTGWPNARTGGRVKTEEDPLDTNLPASMRRTLEAIQRLETAVSGAHDLAGIALRYGAFYGPGTSIEPGAYVVEAVRRRQFPIVGGGDGVWSFLHIDDAASATVAAIEGTATGVFNIVDDEPAEVRVWLPALAKAIGAAPPRRVPAWIARWVVGEAGLLMMTEMRGSSNAKAKRELGWRPRYGSWREGFRTGLSVGRTEAGGLRGVGSTSEVSRR